MINIVDNLEYIVKRFGVNNFFCQNDLVWCEANKKAVKMTANVDYTRQSTGSNNYCFCNWTMKERTAVASTESGKTVKNSS